MATESGWPPWPPGAATRRRGVSGVGDRNHGPAGLTGHVPCGEAWWLDMPAPNGIIGIPKPHGQLLSSIFPRWAR
jgi:hypothetical protein